MREPTEKEVEEAKKKAFELLATDPKFISEAQSGEAKDYHYTEQAKQSYVSAVRKVYDGKNEDIINLMNGLAEEERKDKERILDDAISSLSLIPYGFARIINVILNTTYTNDDFNAAVEQDVLLAAQHLKEYIEKTREEKRKLTKAEEVRKEIDETKAIFEKLAQKKEEPKEEKLTVWQRIKVFFGFKKDDIIFYYNRGLCQ